MRVLIAHNRYRQPGGEERHVDLLEQGLREAGVEVRRFERDSTELERSLARRFAAGVGLAYRPGGGGISAALKSWKPDVVHFHNIWPLMTPAAMRIARNTGAAVVLTLHNYRFACPGGTCPSSDQPVRDGRLPTDCIRGSAIRCALRRNARDSHLERCAYGVAVEAQRRLHLIDRWTDALVAPSSFVKTMVGIAGLPTERVRVIPYGVPLSNARPGSGRFALFAGRLTEAKGVRTLMAAARMAHDVPIVVAGEGPLASEVSGENVTFAGRLDREGMTSALSDAAFVVVPSEWHENFPYSVLEALAAGRPVIATKAGGLPEMVVDGETGLLVPPRSPAELAWAMQRLWRDRDLAVSLGAKALRRAGERYSLAGHIDETLSLYESIRRCPASDGGMP